MRSPFIHIALLAALLGVTECSIESTSVTDSRGLAAALKGDAEYIVIRGAVVADPRDFRQAAVIDGRRVCLQSGPGNTGTLDFGGTANLAHVAAKAGLSVKRLRLRGLAAPDSRTGLQLHAASSALWPTIRGDPGSRFELTDSHVEFPLPPSAADCQAYSSSVAAALYRASGGEGDVSKFQQPDRRSGLFVGGRLSLQLPFDRGIWQHYRAHAAAVPEHDAAVP